MTTNEQLRAAAEDALRLNKEFSATENTDLQSLILADLADDAVPLAIAMLALLPPADGAEPPSEEWLRSVGLLSAFYGSDPSTGDSSTGEFLYLAGGDVQDFDIEYDCDSGEFRMASSQWGIALNIKTRGDFLRLCAALGVPLKESVK